MLISISNSPNSAITRAGYNDAIVILQAQHTTRVPGEHFNALLRRQIPHFDCIVA